ncbi:MAG: hypothetical protein IT352_02635 [Gemmatimonadales bacterium]|nr:hypothetical protein [Gemmatimonadales bacterium]
MFEITMLPAAQGDCLWIEYGSPIKRILIDGGVHATGAVLRQRIEALPVRDRVFELGVVTHVDLDHILGMLQLLKDPPEGLVFKDFWFNGLDHLPEDPTDTSTLGPRMGQEMMELLADSPAVKAWNGAFGKRAVSVGSSKLPGSASGLPSFDVSGMRLTVLGPTGARLARLRPTWEKEMARLADERTREEAGHPEDEIDDETTLGGERIETLKDLRNLAEAPFSEDSSKANGSSIVLLAEHGGRRCLLAGDAFAADVLAAATLVAGGEGEEVLRVDAWKLAHHGGEKNTSPDLVRAVATERYLISTSGTRYDHPRPQTVARVLLERPDQGEARLVFNYRSEFTDVWEDAARFGRSVRYEAGFPATNGTNAVEL